MSTPRMPAEWEAHDAIWLAMPHDRAEWGSFFEPARQTLRVMLAELAADPGSEECHLLVPDPESCADISSAIQHRLPYGDIWLRDTGPIFLHQDEVLVAAGFTFNGWGGKYLFPGDAEVADAVSALARAPLQRHALVLEGGAIDGNGSGTFLTTRECLRNENRNPGRSEADIESALAEAIGCERLIWLDRGLLGDHTDGHIDNLARFVGPRQVFCMSPSGAGDPNRSILDEVHASLRAARTAEGETLEIVTVPSPGKIEGPAGLMAASYCNFLVCNRCVLVPVFHSPSDQEALATLTQLFPGRRIVAIDAYALLTGGGTVHCISQQQPTAPERARS